jgi:hypothetical protein
MSLVLLLRQGSGAPQPAISFAGIQSSEVFGTPTKTPFLIGPIGIVSTEAFGAVRVVRAGGAGVAVAPSLLDVIDGVLFLPMIVSQDLSSVNVADATLQDVLIADTSGV